MTHTLLFNFDGGWRWCLPNHQQILLTLIPHSTFGIHLHIVFLICANCYDLELAFNTLYFKYNRSVPERSSKRQKFCNFFSRFLLEFDFRLILLVSAPCLFAANFHQSWQRINSTTATTTNAPPHHHHHHHYVRSKLSACLV